MRSVYFSQRSWQIKQRGLTYIYSCLQHLREPLLLDDLYRNLGTLSCTYSESLHYQIMVAELWTPDRFMDDVEEKDHPGKDKCPSQMTRCGQRG